MSSVRVFGVLVCIAVLGIVACSSTPQVNPQLAAAITAKNVNPGTLAKINEGAALDYADITNLVTAGVPTQTILNYLQSTQKAYDFSYSQLQALKSAGGTDQLVNYLSETEGFYGKHTPTQVASAPREQPGENTNSPLYQDEQPFAYNQPIIDDWYDSGYEESLYSPFSMN